EHDAFDAGVAPERSRFFRSARAIRKPSCKWSLGCPMRRSYRIGTSVIGMPFRAHSANRSASRSNPVAVRPRDLSRSEAKPHIPLHTSEIGVANKNEATCGQRVGLAIRLSGVASPSPAFKAGREIGRPGGVGFALSPQGISAGGLSGGAGIENGLIAGPAGARASMAPPDNGHSPAG